MIATFAEKQDVREALLTHLSPVPPPKLWKRHVQTTLGVYRTSTPLEPLIDLLQTEFGREALLAAGILVPADDGGYQVAPGLAQKGAQVLVERDPESGDIVELLTDRGVLGSKRPPLTSLCERHEGVVLKDPRQRDNPSRVVLIADSLLSVAVLRALGFPATTGFRLDRLGAGDFRQLIRALFYDRSSGELSGRSQRRKKLAQPFEPVRLEWNLADFTERNHAEIDPLLVRLRRLYDLARHRDTALSRALPCPVIWFWNSTWNEELQRFQTLVEFADRTNIIDALHASLFRCRRSLADRIRSAWPAALPSYEDALTEWSASRGGRVRASGCNKLSGRLPHRMELLHRLFETYDRDVQGQLLRSAAVAASPQQRSLLQRISFFSALNHWLMWDVVADVRASYEGHGKFHLPEERLKQSLQIDTHLLKLFQQFQQCNT